MLNLARRLAAAGRCRARHLAGWLRGLPARGTSFPTRSRRANISQRFHAFNDRFTAHYQRTDAEFSALAKSLQELYGIARALADLVSERLGSMQNALNESHIAGSAGVAAGSLQDLRDGLAEASEELTMLQSIGDKLQRLQALVGSIERVGLSVRMSVFGFAVESQRNTQCQQTFSLFAAELRTLGDHFASVAEAIDSHLAVTRTGQQKEWQTLSADHARLLELAEELKTTANVSADAAQKILDTLMLGLQHAGECMRQIAHHAEEAVFSLQFGDIIRQKTEHIADALRETAKGLDPSASRREFRERATVGDGVIAIQIRQLESVRKEVESAQQTLSKSFQALMEETARMHGTLGQWHTPSANSPNQVDPLLAFKSDLVRMENLHRQGNELRLEARRSTRAAIDASGQLATQVGAVKALNADMHLQALNAIVKTAALGEQGTTLSVLSMHVDSLYRDSQSVVADIVKMVESVLALARGQTESHSEDETSVRSGRLHTGLKQIEFAGDQCRITLASANKLVEQQQQSLNSVRPLLQFLAEQGTAIQGQIEELTAFREILAPWKNSQQTVASPAENVSDRYTMQSEREIHEQGAGAVPVAAPADATVEFFDVPKAPDGEAAALPLAALKENPEGLQAPVVPAAASPGAGMGDNVELF